MRAKKDVIRRRGNVWYIDTYINGVRVQKSLDSVQKEEAKAKAQAYINRVIPISKDTYLSEQNVTIGEIVNHFIAKKSNHIRKSTLSYYLAMKKIMLDHFDENQKVRSITNQDVKLYREYVEKLTTKCSSRVHYLGFLKKVFRNAQIDGLIYNNIMKDFNVSSESDVRICLLSDEEICELLEVLKNSYMYYAVLLALVTGMRKSEVRLLRYSWVDFNSKTINVPVMSGLKTKYSRIVPISDKIFQYIQKGNDEREGKDGYVFSPDDGKTCYNDLRRRFKSAVKQIGREDFRFHDLRHCFSSKYLELYPNHFEELMEICGWRGVKTAMRYAHHTKKYKKQRHARVSKLFSDVIKWE